MFIIFSIIEFNLQFFINFIRNGLYQSQNDDYNSNQFKTRKNMQKRDLIKRNAKISVKRREKLIYLVVQEGHSISKVSRKLNIKLSTARIIVNRYRSNGTIFNKEMKKGSKIEPTVQQNQISERLDQIQEICFPLVPYNTQFNNLMIQENIPLLANNWQWSYNSSKPQNCFIYYWPVLSSSEFSLK